MHDGSEIIFADVPNFSPDGRFIVEINSTRPSCDLEDENCGGEGPPSGYNINIYEADNHDDKNTYQYKPSISEFTSNDSGKSKFLLKNPDCGSNPYFYS